MSLTHLQYYPQLPGHTFPGYCPATFGRAAFIWNGGNTPSEAKQSDPEFRARVEADIQRILNGESLNIGAAVVSGITEEEYNRCK